MHLLAKLLLKFCSAFNSIGYSTPQSYLFTLSYPGHIKGNRCAPGANAAFRRAAAKARRIRRG